MLVRFLSFAASVLGSARHRAILVSCLAVVFAFSSVAGITLFHNGPSADSASARGSNSGTETETPIWLSDQQIDDKNKVRQDTGNQSQASTIPEEAATTEQTEPQEETGAAPAPELTLESDSLTLVDGKGDITAQHTGQNASLTSAVMLGDAETNDLSLTTEKTGNGFTLHITAAETAAANTPYKVKLRIELTGSDGTVTKITKTITVTVPAPQQ